jgi:hypothetical protein
MRVAALHAAERLAIAISSDRACAVSILANRITQRACAHPDRPRSRL